MATAQHELGNEEQELTMLQQMPQQWPDSRLIADVYLRLGEYAFAQGDMPQAIAAYSQALTEGGERYPYICYKLAWCYYNMGEREQAIKTMQALTPTSPPNVPGSTAPPGP